jgi:hypothetical protein
VRASCRSGAISRGGDVAFPNDLVTDGRNGCGPPGPRSHLTPLPTTQGDRQIAAKITSVSTAAGSTTQALGQTRTAVEELSRMSADLRSTVGRFAY